MPSQLVARIFATIAKEVRVVHGSPDAADHGYEGGGDIDCVVEGLDPMWPLRLGPRALLVNRLRYDVTATSWFVWDEDGGAIVDTLEDPAGIGRYGYPTEDLDGGVVEPGPASAYLALKRVRKGDLSEAAWEQVSALAAMGPSSFLAKLEEAIPLNANAVAEIVARGDVPDRALASKVIREVRSRRLRSPSRTASWLSQQRERLVDRLARPTGLYVHLAGPDGVGKSTVADALLESHFGFRRSAHLHWRPGVLPGERGSSEGDHSRPHAQDPRGPLGSAFMTAYNWIDFVLGRPGLWWWRRRSTLVVAERPWWDAGVDPRRYRLRASPKTVSFLGRLVPKADVVLLLQASPATTLARKAEVSGTELDKQARAWREMAPRSARRTVIVDAERPLEEVVATARRAVMAVAGERSLRNLGAGWAAIPRGSPRWWIPRGPARVASAVFDWWTPMTGRGARAWRVARSVARAGGLRALPRATLPQRVIDAGPELLEARESVAIAASNHPGRYLAVAISSGGRIARVAKVADPDYASALTVEEEAIRAMAASLPSPLRAPTILGASHGVLVLEAIATIRRKDPWRLPLEVASAMGTFAARGYTHGDLAPWNLLRSDGGWVLVDWESARTEGTPFEDVFHFVIQSHALLGAPDVDDVVAGVRHGRGWVGEAIAAFAEAAGLDPADAPPAFRNFLELSSDRMDPASPDFPRALAARERLSRAFGSS